MKKRALLLVLSIILASSVSGQGWWIATYTSAANVDSIRNDILVIPEFQEGITTPAGIFYSSDDVIYSLHRVDTTQHQGFGTLSSPTGNNSGYNHTPKAMLLLNGDTSFLLANSLYRSSGQRSVRLTRYYNDQGGFLDIPRTVDWHKPIFEEPGVTAIGAALKQTTDGQLITLGAVASETTPEGNAHELFLIKSDLNGATIWNKFLSSTGDDLPVQLVLAADGGYWILKNVQPDLSNPQTEIWLIKTDGNGELEWETLISDLSDQAKDMILTNDGSLAITGTTEDDHLFVMKLDAEGEPIWRQDYTSDDQISVGRSIIEDEQQHLLVAGEVVAETDGYSKAYLVKLTAQGLPLWERSYNRSGLYAGFNDIVLTPGGEYLMGGFTLLDEGFPSTASYMVKTDTFGIIKGGNISGNVFHDLNLDCLSSSDELNLENWIVKAQSDTLIFFGNTDADGNYSIPVQVTNGDVYDYVVSITPPNNYWQACDNDISVSVAYLDTAVIDFPIQAIVNCPFMETQISNSNIRPCEPGQILISFCNQGTILAEDAMLEVVLPEELAYENSNIPPAQINDQTYSFPLGDIPVNECGELLISVLVDCETVAIGDVLCLETHISPDSICTVPGDAWTGALLEVDYTCTEDSIQYQIQNIGTAAMAMEMDYIIIEDAVLLMQSPFDLDESEDTETDGFPLDGSIYHFIAPQEPGAPGPIILSLSGIDCPNDGGDVPTQYGQSPGNPFTSIHCMTVVGPFDPNDKQALPKGVGEEHYISPDNDIQYTIRFQNVGTDTAFRVVIRDTISNKLDPSTIIPGPSSHPYDWRLNDNGHLTFIFQNIALPDSTTNPAGSQGFVTFKIAQQHDLPDGTLIENRAGIYFDFNAPIITNTYFHNVFRFLDIPSGSVTVSEPEMRVDVMPNPMSNGAWIQLKSTRPLGQLQLSLFDSQGRKVKDLTTKDNKFWLERGDLPSGLYFFTINSEGEWLASGKVIVQ